MHGQRCWIHLKILFDELGGVTRVCLSDYSDLVSVFFVSSFPVRTLFLKAKQSRLRSLRAAFLACLILLILVVAYWVLEVPVGVSPIVVLLGFVVACALAVIGFRWVQTHRLKGVARDLKDSALW